MSLKSNSVNQHHYSQSERTAALASAPWKWSGSKGLACHRTTRVKFRRLLERLLGQHCHEPWLIRSTLWQRLQPISGSHSNRAVTAPFLWPLLHQGWVHWGSPVERQRELQRRLILERRRLLSEDFHRQIIGQLYLRRRRNWRRRLLAFRRQNKQLRQRLLRREPWKRLEPRYFLAHRGWGGKWKRGKAIKRKRVKGKWATGSKKRKRFNRRKGVRYVKWVVKFPSPKKKSRLRAMRIRPCYSAVLQRTRAIGANNYFTGRPEEVLTSSSVYAALPVSYANRLTTIKVTRPLEWSVKPRWKRKKRTKVVVTEAWKKLQRVRRKRLRGQPSNGISMRLRSPLAQKKNLVLYRRCSRHARLAPPIQQSIRRGLFGSVLSMQLKASTRRRIARLRARQKRIKETRACVRQRLWAKIKKRRSKLKRRDRRNLQTRRKRRRTRLKWRCRWDAHQLYKKRLGHDRLRREAQRLWKRIRRGLYKEFMEAFKLALSRKMKCKFWREWKLNWSKNRIHTVKQRLNHLALLERRMKLSLNHKVFQRINEYEQNLRGKRAKLGRAVAIFNCRVQIFCWARQQLRRKPGSQSRQRVVRHLLRNLRRSEKQLCQLESKPLPKTTLNKLLFQISFSLRQRYAFFEK